MKLCSKCKDEAENPTFMTEGGSVFYLCDTCLTDFNKYPTTSLSMYLGVNPETQVTKNIKEARERRARGESLWSDYPK